MLSNRPYLLRAFNQWIVDSSCTPILVIDATNPRCKVPMEYAEGGEIIFNISPAAVRDLKILNDHVEFKASFSGVIHIITVPIKAVLAVYAEENGEGIFFDGEDDSADTGNLDEPEERQMVQLTSVEGTGSAMDSIGQEMTGTSEGAVKNKPFLKLVE